MIVHVFAGKLQKNKCNEKINIIALIIMHKLHAVLFAAIFYKNRARAEDITGSVKFLVKNIR